MEFVAEYYAQKARITVNDQYHPEIEKKDIDILRKAFALILVAPFLSTAAMYMGKELKRDQSFSSNFMQKASTVFRPSVLSKEGSPVDVAPTPLVAAEESKVESDRLKDLYATIREDQYSEELERKEKLKEFSQTLRNNKFSSRTQQRIKNASPFHKNQQAKRFGINGAKIVTSQRERREEVRQFEAKQGVTSTILDDKYKNYRDQQRGSQSPVTASFSANKQQEIDEARVMEEQQAEAVRPSRFQRQQAYLRSLKFGAVRDKFLLVRSSGSAQKKVTLAYYIVPAILATAMATNNYLQVSFGVYLKYQGMVDQFYLRKKSALAADFDPAQLTKSDPEVQLIQQSKDIVEKSALDPRFVPQFKIAAAQQQQ